MIEGIGKCIHNLEKITCSCSSRNSAHGKRTMTFEMMSMLNEWLGNDGLVFSGDPQNIDNSRSKS